jgi:tetratricopeptide (TPR) repeat protein
LDTQTRKKEVERLEKKMVASAEQEKKREDEEVQVKFVGLINLNKPIHNEKYWLQVIEEETHKIDKAHSSSYEVDYTILMRRCYANLKVKNYEEAANDADEVTTLINEKIKEEQKQDNITRMHVEKLVVAKHKGVALYHRERYQEAIKLLSEVIKLYKDSKKSSDKLSSDIYILALKSRAQAYLFYNKLEDTIGDCSRMIDTVINYVPPEKKKTLTGSDESDLNIGVVHLLRQPLGRMNFLVDAYKIKVNALARQKQFDKGFEEIEEATESVHKIGAITASTNVFTAIIDQKDKKNMEKSVESCNKRLSEMKDYISEQQQAFNAAEKEFRLGKDKLSVYRKLTKQTGEEEDIDESEGTLREEMIKHLEKAVEIETYPSADRFATLAEALYEAHKYKESLEYAQKGIIQDPTQWKSYWVAGNCNIAKRKMDKGIQTYQVCLTMN